MKQRNGFVSNSSSSSFCLLGYRVDDRIFEQEVKILEVLGNPNKVDLTDEDAVTDAIYSLDHGKPSDISVVNDNSCIYIGNLFAYVNDADGGIKELDFDLVELSVMAEKLKQLGNALGESKPKLYVGIVASWKKEMVL